MFFFLRYTTLKEKIEILGKLDCGVKAVDLCKQFNLNQSTLSTWKKQRCKLNEMVDAGKVLNTKRNRDVLATSRENPASLVL